MLTPALYVLGAAAELLGLALVGLEVRDGRRAAKRWLAEAQGITEHGKDWRSHGLGAADERQLGARAVGGAATHPRRGVLADSRRGIWGALLIAGGIIAGTVGSLTA